MEMKILLYLHLISAVVFVGYFLLLSFKTVPAALRAKNLQIIKDFEKPLHSIVMNFLIVQILTGFRLSMILLPIGQWFDFSNPISSAISLKLILLGILIIFIVLKKAVFSKKENLAGVITVIILIDIIALLLIWTGVSLRFGGI